MKLVLIDKTSLLEAISGGELYGYKPSEVYDATSWKFPVLLETDEKKKTFTLVEESYKETKSENVQVVSSKKSNKVKKYFIIAAAVVAVVIIAVTVYSLV